MGKKASKASRKYATSGRLKNEIQTRKKHQQVKRNVERRKAGKSKHRSVHTEEREYLEDDTVATKNGKVLVGGDAGCWFEQDFLSLISRGSFFPFFAFRYGMTRNINGVQTVESNSRNLLPMRYMVGG